MGNLDVPDGTIKWRQRVLRVGFEPTKLDALDLKSNPFDHSGTVALFRLGKFCLQKCTHVIICWNFPFH